MRKTWKIAILAGALLAGIGGTAAANPHVRLSIGLGLAPAVYAPYYPAPAYYPAPQVVYAPPSVYYAPPVRVVYGSYPYGRFHGHRHWR